MVTRSNPLYAPSPPPIAGGADELRVWCLREFERIADAIQNGRVQWVLLDVQKVKPDKPQVGQLAYFAENVVSAGSEDGTYEYSSGAWFKL